MKRVFLYVRVSTEEQALHGLSIEAQTSALQKWAKDNGHKVVGVYTDAGISARKPATKRPELQRLLNDVRAGEGELIVFTKLDRWFRNLAEYYKVQEILEKYHVDWKTIHEDYDTTTASGRLKINEMKRQKLQPLTGESPFGYKIKDKKFIKDPEKEEAVTAFFHRFLETGSISEARGHVRAQFGEWWSYQKAHQMLDMPCYHGHYFGVDGMTPPYITKEQYQKIQSMRRRIVRKTAQNRVYIFSGLISCGECGARMGGRVNTKQETYFYNCHSHYLHATDCQNSVNMTEKKIEKLLIDTIEEKMKQWKVHLEEVSTLQKQRDFQKEIIALRSKLRKLKDLYLNDLIDLNEYRRDKESYEAKIAELSAQSKAQEQPNFERIESLLHYGWETAYNGLKKEKKRVFWRILIKEIRIYPDRHVEYDLNV